MDPSFRSDTFVWRTLVSAYQQQPAVVVCTLTYGQSRSTQVENKCIMIDYVGSSFSIGVDCEIKDYHSYVLFVICRAFQTLLNITVVRYQSCLRK